MEWLSVVFALTSLCILVLMIKLTVDSIRVKKGVTYNKVNSEGNLKKRSATVPVLGILASILLILAIIF